VVTLQGKGVRQVACGDEFSMALTDNDDVYTWGKGDEGQLGHGGWSPERVPRLVQSLRGKSVAAIAAGSRHAACVTESGELYTWGCGKNGRLGHGGGTDFAVGMVVKGLLDERVARVALGVAHTVALTETGRIFTWGANHFGQLGHGHTLELDRPVALATLSAGGDGAGDPHLHNNHDGNNDGGGVAEAVSDPARGSGRSSPPLGGLPASATVVAVRCGAYHSACLTATGGVFTWGCGNKGVLGHGDCQRQTRPVEVLGLRGKACSDLALGLEHCAAVTAHVWIPDDEAEVCLQCEVEFSFFTRRSHCRHCGRIFCRSCASRYVAIPRFGFHKPVRVCDVCHDMLTGITQ
jgi:E3 ubiquitin-protein ligase HERC2